MKNLLASLCLLAALPALAASHSEAPAGPIRNLFEKMKPCPVKVDNGVCSSYTVVYIDPLCHGGRDRTANMKWLPVLDLKKKELDDQALCSGGGGVGGRYTKTVAQPKHAAVHQARMTSDTTCYTGPRGGHYRIINGHKRYGC